MRAERSDDLKRDDPARGRSLAPTRICTTVRTQAYKPRALPSAMLAYGLYCSECRMYDLLLSPSPNHPFGPFAAQGSRASKKLRSRRNAVLEHTRLYTYTTELHSSRTMADQGQLDSCAPLPAVLDSRRSPADLTSAIHALLVERGLTGAAAKLAKEAKVVPLAEAERTAAAKRVAAGFAAVR